MSNACVTQTRYQSDYLKGMIWKMLSVISWLYDLGWKVQESTNPDLRYLTFLKSQGIWLFLASSVQYKGIQRSWPECFSYKNCRCYCILLLQEPKDGYETVITIPNIYSSKWHIFGLSQNEKSGAQPQTYQGCPLKLIDRASTPLIREDGMDLSTGKLLVMHFTNLAFI